MYGISWWFFSPKIPTPKSDVPIEYKIDWWAYQDAVHLESLKTKVIFDSLNLFNSTSVVEYNLEGTLSYSSHWRPYIKSIHINERWEFSTKDGNKVGVIELTPIVAVEDDESYLGEEIKFSISVQDYLNSGDWGENIYNVSSLGKISEIRLIQRK